MAESGNGCIAFVCTRPAGAGVFPGYGTRDAPAPDTVVCAHRNRATAGSTDTEVPARPVVLACLPRNVWRSQSTLRRGFSREYAAPGPCGGGQRPRPGQGGV